MRTYKRNCSAESKSSCIGFEAEPSFMDYHLSVDLFIKCGNSCFQQHTLSVFKDAVKYEKLHY